MKVLAPVEVEGMSSTSAAPAPVTAPQTEPGYVALVNSDGEVQSIPAQNAEKAITQFQYRPATRGEFNAARDGVSGSVRAGLGGALRGATFGASDPLAMAFGDALEEGGGEKVRRSFEEDREQHPLASTVGEIGGSLLPLAFGAPPVEAGADLGEGFVARAGQRALAAAPREFAVGTGYGLGHQLTEDTLGDHDMVASKYLASGLEGGLINLLLGAGLVAGGGALGDAIVGRAAGEGVASRAVGGVSRLAEEQAAKGAMPASSLAASEMQKLGATAEEQQLRVRQIGRTLLDEGITTPFATKATQATRLTERASEVGEELGAMRRGFDGTAVRPSAKSVVERIKSEVMDPLVARPFSAAEQASVAPYVEEIGRLVDKNASGDFESFDQLYKMRRALDKKLDPKLWNRVPGTAPAGFEELGQIRGILESEFEKAADRAAALQGDETSTKYRIAKALYGDLATAQKWATKGAAREAQNRAVSLTDTIMAGAGIASGHGALAVGGALGNKAMRTYGNQIAATALNRIGKLEVLQRAAAKFDARLASSTKAFFGGGPVPAKKLRRVAITPAERVALRTAINNPSALAEHVGDMVAARGLGDAAPNVAGAMTQTVMRAAAYVASKLPPEPSPIGVSFGPPKPRALGPRGQADTDRAIDALDTERALDDFAHRRLSRQQVEAIKIVNPPLFAALQNSIREYGEANNPKTSIQQEMALAIVFDTPVSSYTRGATIRGFQKAFAQGAPSDDPASAGGQANKPIGKGPNPQTAQALMSPTDRSEAQGAL